MNVLPHFDGYLFFWEWFFDELQYRFPRNNFFFFSLSSFNRFSTYKSLTLWLWFYENVLIIATLHMASGKWRFYLAIRMHCHLPIKKSQLFIVNQSKQIIHKSNALLKKTWKQLMFCIMANGKIHVCLCGIHSAKWWERRRDSEKCTDARYK